MSTAALFLPVTGDHFAPDGERIVACASNATADHLPRMRARKNWFEEVLRRAPAGTSR